MSDSLDRLHELHDQLASNPANERRCGLLLASIDLARAQQDPLMREAAELAAISLAKAIVESL